MSKSGRTWFVGDLHLGHSNIVKFTDNQGNRIRPFDDIDHHDEMLIKYFNELVHPEDRVYFLGDVVIARKNLEKIGRFNGRKKLIKGNHDIFKLKDYLPYFEDISAYRIYPEQGWIFSHIPVHTCQLYGRFKMNFHGHMHSNRVMREDTHIPDERYVNLCPEWTGWKPVEFHDLLKKYGGTNVSKK